MQYKIFEANMERLEKKLTRIANKCQKYGNDFTYEKVGEEYQEQKDEYGNKYFAKYILVEVTGTAIINDWQFVAAVDHTSHGNIIKKCPGINIEIPEKYYKSNPICEHCNSDRFRRNTYIVQNTKSGEFKQVGKSCLADFTHGMSADGIAHYISLHDELIQGKEPYTECGNKKYIDIKIALRYATETVLKFGYVKSDGDRPTKYRALEYYMVDNDNKGMMYEYRSMLKSEMEAVDFDVRSKKVIELSEKALAWILNQEESNNYIHNLKAICSAEYIAYDNFGILASLIPCYERAMEKEAQIKLESENCKLSDYVGNIGDRITVTIQDFKIVTSWETNYGITAIYKIMDEDGNVYTWKTTKGIGDQAKKITGTIKAHNEFMGIKQTEITRCRVA